MALVLDDRVKETSTTTGTGTFDLDGAVSSFQTFVAGIGSTNTTYYAIINSDAAEWEVGVGTVTDAAPDTLARTSVLTSSNGDSAVNFSAGTKDVFCTLPASKTMLGANNLSDVADAETSRANLGIVDVTNSNLILNPSMHIWQRADSFTDVGVSNTESITDRYTFLSQSSAPARWTVSRETSGGPKEKDIWMKLLCTTADGVVAAGDTQYLQQKMEGALCQGLLGTTGFIDEFTFSFDVFAHIDGGSSITFPAKFGVGVKFANGARQYHTDVTIATADTWERVSIAVPLNGTATMPNTTGAGIEVDFGLYGEPTATDATWEARSFDEVVTPNSENWADSTNNYLGITNLKLEPGGSATSYSYSSQEATVDRDACFRRLWVINATNVTGYIVETGGTAISTTVVKIGLHPPVKMTSGTGRTLVATAAEWDVSDGSTATNCSGLSVSAGTSLFEKIIMLTCTVGSGLTQFRPYYLIEDGTDNGQIIISSEI